MRVLSHQDDRIEEELRYRGIFYNGATPYYSSVEIDDEYRITAWHDIMEPWAREDYEMALHTFNVQQRALRQYNIQPGLSTAEARGEHKDAVALNVVFDDQTISITYGQLIRLLEWLEHEISYTGKALEDE